MKRCLVKQDSVTSDVIGIFFAEFNEKEIDGKMLAKFESNALLFDQFRSVFSKQNQDQTIWNVFETAILQIQVKSGHDNEIVENVHVKKHDEDENASTTTAEVGEGTE